MDERDAAGPNDVVCRRGVPGPELVEWPDRGRVSAPFGSVITVTPPIDGPCQPDGWSRAYAW